MVHTTHKLSGSILFRVMVQMLLGLPVMEDKFHWLEIDGNVVKEEAHVAGRRLLRYRQTDKLTTSNLQTNLQTDQQLNTITNRYREQWNMCY